MVLFYVTKGGSIVTTTITYKRNCPINAQQLISVFASSGIKRPIQDVARIQKMIDHANLLITAWDGEKLIGIARCVTDFSYCCYVSDLAVCKEYQQKGIGKTLLNKIKEEATDQSAIILLSAPSAVEYYPHIGFEQVDVAFRIPRSN
ncbi:GCN5 family acetyltransferase [Bacillus sp. VT 712]|uniref:GCN5 family acetyltransferase n=1 Tax=Priestia veravalensis TaxID=1414648 RepID=A0A0V8JGP6_9BACI|nr:GCN5 family acetyltransferase [Priestia veravalensis]KZB92270.1 GCN5 family acetyltransferase [Bacillus sp. VT 712]QCS53402.1 GNAT family N-acetyltransferase [Priestia flexa]